MVLDFLTLKIYKNLVLPLSSITFTTNRQADNHFYKYYLFVSNLLYSLKSVFLIKGTLQVLRQFLTTESPLKMMKNVFYFTLKALFVFKIFKFLS